MICVYSGTILFIIGSIMTMILNKNVHVSMSGDFQDIFWKKERGENYAIN